jgi:hypothetical protein
MSFLQKSFGVPKLVIKLVFVGFVVLSLYLAFNYATNQVTDVMVEFQQEDNVSFR